MVYPGRGVTKADLVAYYAAVAERMLPYIAKRPLSLLRCPQGRAKYCFFQKHDTGGFPDAMKSLLITEKDGSREDYFYIEDSAGLIAGTQMNVLEWHLWGADIEQVEKPERIIFDIDPDEGLGFAEVRSAARDISKALAALDLESYPLVTGGKGVHVIAPLRPAMEWAEVKAFCKAPAQRSADNEPDRFVATMSKAKRKGKLFIDYLRNERGSTAIAPGRVAPGRGAGGGAGQLGRVGDHQGRQSVHLGRRRRTGQPWLTRGRAISRQPSRSPRPCCARLLPGTRPARASAR
ncbi:non-homologous end-joining DNA ligase [Devosia sp. A8/3-2]|nr:non-homologous end-joining DNA ligase [Devosia sp. A8/3-2]